MDSLKARIYDMFLKYDRLISFDTVVNISNFYHDIYTIFNRI